MSFEDQKGKNEISRREFFKASTLAAATLATGGVMESCKSHGSSSESGGGELASFEVAPPPIPERRIKETVTADVVVVGAGISGVIAALSARQSGARTIVLQKGPTVITHGTGFGAINSKLQQEAGMKLNALEIINEFNYQCGNKPNFQLLKVWAEHSGEAIDWLNDITTAKGMPGVFSADAGGDETKHGGLYWHNSYQTAHNFKGKMPGKNVFEVANIVAKTAMEAGVEFRFRTPAVQLIKDGQSGRVTGVIAKTDAGEYKRFNAKRAVILCTGDYGNNPEMVAKYCPSAIGAKVYYQPRYNTGDGHRMGLWVGAAMERAPHAQMIHVHSSLDFGRGDAPNRPAPWLAVNNDGERFVNEEIPFWLMANQNFRQPRGDGRYHHIVDADWQDNLKQFPPRSGMGPTEPAQFAKCLRTGTVLQASSIAELAALIGVPPENLSATVNRYNELVDKGVDEDFGKLSRDLTPIRKAPFYAMARLTCVSVILGGLRINNRMQVLTKEEKVIPGLYAAGNTSGDFFGNSDYPFPIIAVSVGRAMTFGRQAGLNAAEEKG